MNNDNKCYFANFNKRSQYACRILKVEKCDGLDTSCSFFKTEEKFNSDRDKAIDRCREKGLCNDCKYNQKFCMKNDEELE